MIELIINDHAVSVCGGKTLCRCISGSTTRTMQFHYTDSCSHWCCAQLGGDTWEHDRHGRLRSGQCSSGPTKDDHKPGILTFVDAVAKLGLGTVIASPDY